jgi:hypothetical protein
MMNDFEPLTGADAPIVGRNNKLVTSPSQFAWFLSVALVADSSPAFVRLIEHWSQRTNAETAHRLNASNRPH